MSRLPNPIGIRSVVTWLPDTCEKTNDAIASGRLGSEEADATGYDKLPVSDEAAPEMAVRAGRLAVQASGVSLSEIGLHAHAWTYYQGHDFWAPAHFVAAGVGADHALPVGIQQMCNGAGVAMELVVDHLRSPGRLPAATITTADRFCGPGFDRWRGDYGLWYGDGATAAVLHREAAVSDDLHLLALATVVDSTLEQMHRGDDDFGDAPMTHSATIDIRRTKRAYLTRHGSTFFAETVANRVPALIRSVLADADIGPDDPRIAFVLLPRLGKKALAAAYRSALAEVTNAPALDLGSRTGHLGAGDLLANLAAVGTETPLAAGDIAVAISAGGGFSWSAAVVRRPVPENVA